METRPTREHMNEQTKLLVASLVSLAFGFGICWAVKPDPTVEIRGILKPPFVEVLVNGKPQKIGDLKLQPKEPEKKKGWWGTNDGKMHFGDVATRCECEDCRDGCSCGCGGPIEWVSREAILAVFAPDDKTFTSLANDPKFLSGIAAIIEKINAWLGYVDQNADGWKRDAARHAEWTATQVTWGLVLIGGVLAALVINNFLVYGCLNTLAKR